MKFPSIEGLYQIPDLHNKYALFVLEHILQTINAENEFEIGIHDGDTAEIRFQGDTDDLEVCLEFHDHTFRVSVYEHGDAFNAGQFRYNLTLNDLEERIPDIIRAELREAAFNGQPKTVNL